MNFRKKKGFAAALAVVIAGAVLFFIYTSGFFETPPGEIAPPIPKPQKRVEPEPVLSLKDQAGKIVAVLMEEGSVRQGKGERELALNVSQNKVLQAAKTSAAGIDPLITVSLRRSELTFSRDGESLRYRLVPTPSRQMEGRALLAIVIDDIGNAKEAGDAIVAMNDLTLAIIPDLKYSRYFAEKGRSAGKDILVHVPMEPLNNADKYQTFGPMLKTDMSDDEVMRLTEQFLAAVPHAIGANNHMGSRFTQSDQKMKVFLDQLGKRKMFFLDSRTSGASRAFELASNAGIPALRRDVFLDHDISEEKISEQLDLAVHEAQKNGSAIAIGHPHQQTLNVLRRRLDEIRKKVTIVPVSRLLR